MLAHANRFVTCRFRMRSMRVHHCRRVGLHPCEHLDAARQSARAVLRPVLATWIWHPILERSVHRRVPAGCAWELASVYVHPNSSQRAAKAFFASASFGSPPTPSPLVVPQQYIGGTAPANERCFLKRGRSPSGLCERSVFAPTRHIRGRPQARGRRTQRRGDSTSLFRSNFE